MQNSDPQNMGMAPGGAGSPALTGGPPLSGHPHQNMGGPMGVNMGGMPGPHSNGMAPGVDGVNGAAMQHGAAMQQQAPANGQMAQMQGMRYDQRNDGGQQQYPPHGMHPYGHMQGLQQPGMGMPHGMQNMRNFPAGQMHMEGGQPPQMGQMPMGPMGQMQPGDPSMHMGQMPGQMGQMAMGMPAGPPGPMMQGAGPGVPTMQGGMPLGTGQMGGLPPQMMPGAQNPSNTMGLGNFQQQQNDFDNDDSGSGLGGSQGGGDGSGGAKGGKGGLNDTSANPSGGGGGTGQGNSKTTKKQLAKMQKEEVKKQKRDQAEAKKQEKEREKQAKQHQRQLKKEAKTNPSAAAELKQLQMQQKTQKVPGMDSGSGGIAISSSIQPNGDGSDTIAGQGPPLMQVMQPDQQMMASGFSAQQPVAGSKGGAPPDNQPLQMLQEQHRQNTGQNDLMDGDEDLLDENMNDTSQEGKPLNAELRKINQHMQAREKELAMLHQKDQGDPQSAKTQQQIAQANQQLQQSKQRHALLVSQQAAKVAAMTGGGPAPPGAGGHDKSKHDGSGGGSGSVGRQQEQPGAPNGMQQEENGHQRASNGEQNSKNRPKEPPGRAPGGTSSKQPDQKDRNGAAAPGGSSNPGQPQPAQNHQQQATNQTAHQNPGAHHQQYPPQGQNKGNSQIQDQQQMMQSQQYQSAQHQAAQQQLRQAAQSGQITQAVKAMILSGQVANPFGPFPGNPGGSAAANGQNNGQQKLIPPGVMNPQLGPQFAGLDSNSVTRLLQMQQTAALAGMQGMPPGIGMMGGMPPGGIPFNNMQAAQGNMMVAGQQAAAAGLQNQLQQSKGLSLKQAFAQNMMGPGAGAFGPGGVPIMPPGVAIPGLPQGLHGQQMNPQALLAVYQQHEQLQRNQAQSRMQGAHGNHQANYQGGEANGARTMPADKKESAFDINLQKSMNELKMEEIELCGKIRVKMPHLNLNNLKGYEFFLKEESYKNKLQFLKKTIYNTRQIKKTLDLRKYSEIERKPRLKMWKDRPDKMLKQKINLRRLKIRVKRMVEREKKLKSGEIKNKYSCPVYLCKSKHPTEDLLVDHYNKEHAELVNLGLKLKRSKKARKEEELRKAHAQSNRIVIHDPASKEQQGTNQKKKDAKKDKNQDIADKQKTEPGDEDKSNSDSDSSSESENENDGNDNQNKRGEREKRQQDEISLTRNMWGYNDDDEKYDIYGDRHGILAEGNLDDDSDLEDLLEMEKIEIEKKKRKEQRRQLRRQHRAERLGDEQQLSEGLMEDDEDDISDGDTYDLLHSNINQLENQNSVGAPPQDRLTTIQRLIQNKKEKKASQMKAKISNDFIDQVLIFTLINKGYIKETLSKEYQRKLDADMAELDEEINN